MEGYCMGAYIGGFGNLASGDFAFIIGLTLWFLGFAGNVYHEDILYGLRRTKKGDRQEYKLPTGGLFRYISFPHYLSE